MGIAERLIVGIALINELEKAVSQLEQHKKLSENAKKELPEILRRAVAANLKMKTAYLQWDKPYELLEQIEKMEGVIKRLEYIYNKHVC